MQQGTQDEVDGFAQGTLTVVIALLQSLTKEQKTEFHKHLKNYHPKPGASPEYAFGWRSALNEVIRHVR